jgi:hypothetical protein
MAKINLTGSSYRVAKGKAELAREEKWLKKSQLTTKINQELKKRKPAEKDIDQSGGRDQNKTPGAEDSGSLDQGKATELMGPESPDKNKER